MAIASCHSEPFTTPGPALSGPLGSGNDITLTLNPEQDYWPAWTQDGRGVLYAFVDQSEPSHRCVGLLPSGGGTRLWELCDNRPQRSDSSSNYAGFALDSTGRLLLAEGVSANSTNVAPQPLSTLWLTDTARPFVRTALAASPMTIGGVQFTWFSDPQWTGPSTFVALAGQFNSVAHCINLIVTGKLARQCLTRDTVWDIGPSAIVSGTMSAQGAALRLVPGTTGATDYSFADGGGTLVFSTAFSSQLFRVPAGGGTATAVFATPVPGTQIAGVSCKGDMCVYALDSVTVIADQPTFSAFYSQPDDSLTLFGTMELRRVSLSTGADALVAAAPSPSVYASPAVSPATGDVVVQVGGNWGRLQTFATYGSGSRIVDVRNGVLHLLRAVVP